MRARRDNGALMIMKMDETHEEWAYQLTIELCTVVQACVGVTL